MDWNTPWPWLLPVLAITAVLWVLLEVRFRRMGPGLGHGKVLLIVFSFLLPAASLWLSWIVVAIVWGVSSVGQ